MLHMCVYMYSRFIENHPIRILEDGPLISEGVLSQPPSAFRESHSTWVYGRVCDLWILSPRIRNEI
jgi:hypothetical protein